MKSKIFKFKKGENWDGDEPIYNYIADKEVNKNELKSWRRI